ncbi:acyltransferase family protein [Vibrio anguillarum]|uniref:acyltransferase family protein n=3 Tax=Vibrio TaxID=662 RepID=UPI0013ED4EDA|nr:acyltransferase family protein [Vibrio anguillarum]
MKRITYRPQLDGLRTLAVLSVIIYHADISVFGVRFFSGGYLGVDVFFVLSGYLITKIIYSSLDKNDFSFLEFYISRFKRIVPALLFVLCVVSLAAYIILLPSEFLLYAKSLKAAMLFQSNIYFSSEDTYDAAASIYKPLLHTWSLSVEWQFYLIFPIVFLCINKIARTHALMIFFALSVFSFLYSSWIVEYSPNSAFYLLQSRCWELLCGGIVAIFESEKVRLREKFIISRFCSTISVGSILVILASLIFIDHTYSHPSYITLLPVLATMIYIYSSGEHEVSTKVLAYKPIVFFGVVSYSLYLWHQPIFTFYRFNVEEKIGFLPLAAMLALIFLLSVMTYYFIERPFRLKKMEVWKWCAIVFVFSVLYFSAKYIEEKDGLPERLGPLKSIFYSMDDRKTFSISNIICHAKTVQRSCYAAGSDESKGTILLIGDSHAATLSKNLYEQAMVRGYGYRQFTPSGCTGLDSIMMYREQNGNSVPIENCFLQSREISKFLKEHRSDKLTIVHVSRLPLYLTGTRFDNGEGGAEIGERYWAEPVEPSANLDKEIIKSLEGWVGNSDNLVLVYPIPEVGWNVKYQTQRALQVTRSLVEKQIIMHNLDLSTSYEAYLERSKRAYQILDEVDGATTRIYPRDIFCADSQRCVTHSQSELYYYDDDHLSTHGAKMVVAEIFNKLDKRATN